MAVFLGPESGTNTWVDIGEFSGVTGPEGAQGPAGAPGNPEGAIAWQPLPVVPPWQIA